MDKNQTDILYFLIITTSLLVFFSVLVINLLLVSRNRKLRHINEMHRLQVLQEKELANVRLEVTETTLREVAADLHDDTGQLLTVAIMQLNRLSKNAWRKVVSCTCGMIWMMTLYGQTLRWSYTHSGSSRSLCPTPSNMQKQQKSIFN